jgi:hypothetical protein
MILSVFCVYRALEGGTWAGFVLAGVALAAAYLVKSMALLYFPLPVLVLVSIREYRCRRGFWGTTLELGVVAAILLPWLGVVYSIDPAWVFGQRAGFVSQSLQTGSSLLDTLQQTLLALPNYYAVHLEPYFVLAPLLVAAWAYVWISAAKGTKTDRIVGLAILLFCPILVFQGRVGFRPRIAMGLVLLLYIALARLLSAIVRYTRSLLERLELDRARLAAKAIPVLVPLVVIVVQGWLDEPETLLEYARDFNTLDFVRLGAWHLEHEGRIPARQATQWLLENVPPGSALMGWEAEQRAMSYFSEVRYGFWQFPYLFSDDEEFSFEHTGSDVILLFADERGNQFLQSLEYGQLAAITEDHLLALIHDASIDYIIVGLRGALAHYFLGSPGFVKVADFGCGHLQVFRVLHPEPSRHEPLITDEAFVFLESVRLGNPARYGLLVDGFLGERLGWTEEDVQQIEEQMTLPRTIRVTAKEYAQRVQYEGRLETAIALHQGKAALIPDSPWPHVTLGALHAATGNQEAALDSYHRAIKLATDYQAVAACIDAGIDRQYLPLYLAQRESFHTPVLTETLGGEAAYVTHRFLDHLDDAKVGSELSQQSIRRSAFVVDREPKGVLLQHPASQVSYGLQVPESSYLRFGLALSPEVWQPDRGDGVQFDIYVGDTDARWHVFSEYIDPKNERADQRWHDHEIDLSQWSGEAITLTFVTDPGPDGDARYDWAGWAEPRIVQPIAYDFLAEFSSADLGGAGDGPVRQDTLDLDYEPRPILFHHPPYQVTYRVDVPKVAGLHFGVGMDPASWSSVYSDGVEYNIYVRHPDEQLATQVFHHFLDPQSNPDDRHWFDGVADLSDYGGQTVEVIFETLPGPAGDANSDWGGWSQPILVADCAALLNPDASGASSSVHYP